MYLKKIILLVAITVSFTNTFAQEKTAEELAKMSQNPLANMMSFPFQNNTTFGNGPNSDRTSNVLNFQPVLPFFNGHLITRTIIPLVSSPDYSSESGSNTGFGDINFSAFYSPTSKNGLTWGIGPTLVIPTFTDFSSHKFSMGASFLILKMNKKFVYGFLLSNSWSVAGSEDYSDVNSFMGQYFINMNFPKGWYISSAPIITANWKAPKGQQWTVPFGGGAGKIVRIGKLPVNIQAQAFYNAVRPDNYGGFSTRFQIQIMLPK
ncbi:MAG: neuromedin U [Bacteroidetes bacterium 4572_112]|nr:MAG: neuromedin U [Bacteroidetes bacterium 4572_112]